MSTRGNLATGARRALWVSALGIVLAGLFGMHGLDSHGMPGMEAAHAGIAHAEASASTAHEVKFSPAAPHGESAATADRATSEHPAMDVGMEVTCMAILAVALLVLLRQLHGRPARRMLWTVSRPVRAPAFMGRDPDPPSLIALSIQRC